MAVSSAERRGVAYAFGRGLDPRGKDGVRAHPLVFAAGVLLHLGIAAALLRMTLLLTGTTIPNLARTLLATFIIAGVLAASALVVRRMRSPVLRIVSIPDDYISSALVILFLGAAEASLLTPGASAAFVLATIVLAAYAPFGKIRHCVLFFVTRARFGRFIGQRGVLGTRGGI